MADFLIEFAKKIGKPDPEVYVDTGNGKQDRAAMVFLRQMMSK